MRGDDREDREETEGLLQDGTEAIPQFATRDQLTQFTTILTLLVAFQSAAFSFVSNLMTWSWAPGSTVK